MIKIKPLTEKGRVKEMRRAHHSKLLDKKTNAITLDVIDPKRSHDAVELIRKRVLPKLKSKKVTVIEVGPGMDGISPYLFAHMLEREGKSYNVVTADIQKKVLDSIKGLDEAYFLSGMPRTRFMATFKTAVKYNPKTDGLKVPRRWKSRIHFVKVDALRGMPRVQADIVNAVRYLYTLPRYSQHLGFQHLVDMVKPGGFLHTDYIPLPKGSIVPWAHVSSAETIERNLDYEAFGLKLVHVSQGHVIFQKVE